MENQTTEQPAQSEQPNVVVQDTNSQATAEVKETVLTEQPIDNFKDLIPDEYREEKSLPNLESRTFFLLSKAIGALGFFFTQIKRKKHLQSNRRFQCLKDHSLKVIENILLLSD